MRCVYLHRLRSFQIDDGRGLGIAVEALFLTATQDDGRGGVEKIIFLRRVVILFAIGAGVF